MVTVTTPSRANAVPSYWGTAPEPFTKAPPWTQTNTGRLADGSGVQMFRLRQSSPAISGSSNSWSNGHGYGLLGTVGPNQLASRTPGQRGGGSGGRRRRSPNGAAAYGRPRKRLTPRSLTPETRPCSMSAVTFTASVLSIG